MRLLVLAHDALGPRTAKTANAALKYAADGWSGDTVVAVVDRSKAGQDAGAFVGPHGAGVPVVASVADGLRLGADALLVGIAPVGGALPADWMPDLEAALAAGLRVVSGLHTPLRPAFPRHARLIRDVRHEHPPQRITTGEGLTADSLVVLHVGTDCNSGKMTSAIELTREARRRGLKAAFVATGQTGIMVGCDAGAPIDALVSDFVAGAVEECVLKAAQGRPDLIFVEGQGSLTHPAYSGVTASLLHGAFPDVLVLADEPRREHVTLKAVVRFRKQSRALERDLNEMHLRPTTQARVGAVALMTPGLTDHELAEEVARAEKEMGVPAGDAFRGGAGRILDGVLAEARRRGLWDDKGFVPGSKAKRVATGVV
jgi:uncharacterized NAD-dependent epimerase/dehydratase family protein